MALEAFDYLIFLPFKKFVFGNFGYISSENFISVQSFIDFNGSEVIIESLIFLKFLSV